VDRKGKFSSQKDWHSGAQPPLNIRNRSLVCGEQFFIMSIFWQPRVDFIKVGDLAQSVAGSYYKSWAEKAIS
jgi:hypothetical protein